MTGETNARSFVIFWGRGSNGKSLLLKLLDKILYKAYKPVLKKYLLKAINPQELRHLTLKMLV